MQVVYEFSFLSSASCDSLVPQLPHLGCNDLNIVGQYEKQVANPHQVPVSGEAFDSTWALGRLAWEFQSDRWGHRFLG